jgi:hypothetical protein
VHNLPERGPVSAPMKQRIWAKPGKKWGGFRFTAYALDSEKVLGLPLTLARTVDGKKEEVATTVGEIYDKLADRRVEFDEPSVYMTVKTDTEELCFGPGPGFSLRVLHALLWLRNEGVNPFEALWYWYDHESGRTEPHELYSFFVVAGGEIVRERFSFRDYPGSSFDPSVFAGWPPSSLRRPAGLFVPDDAWVAARDLHQYSKFCTETHMGRLMGLRSDRPKLLKFLNRSLRRSMDFDNPFETASLLRGVLTEVRFLRWVLIGILLLVLALWLGRR